MEDESPIYKYLGFYCSVFLVVFYHKFSAIYSLFDNYMSLKFGTYSITKLIFLMVQNSRIQGNITEKINFKKIYDYSWLRFKIDKHLSIIMGIESYLV